MNVVVYRTRSSVACVALARFKYAAAVYTCYLMWHCKADKRSGPRASRLTDFTPVLQVLTSRHAVAFRGFPGPCESSTASVSGMHTGSGAV